MNNIVETLSFKADSCNSDYEGKLFSKEAGMKCDSAGWMKINLCNDMDKFQQISTFAKAHDIKLRGMYSKKINLADSKWYRFSPKNHFAMCDYSYAQKKEDYYYYKIKAYKAPKGCTVIDDYVSQSFVNAYKELNLTGLDFIWEPDGGKYQADSFYKLIVMEKAKKFMYPGIMSCLKKITYDYINMKPVSNQCSMEQLREFYTYIDLPDTGYSAGHLCEVERYMDNLDVVLPIAIDYESMPATDFSYCYTDGYPIIYLIREEALKKMDHAGVIRLEDFEPVSCINPNIHLDLIQDGAEYDDMKLRLEQKDHFEKMRLKLAEKERPEFIPSEKEVIAMLKKCKTNHSEYFLKPITSKLLEEVMDSPYHAMGLYYKVACSGRLAEDTYEYYSYEEAKDKNELWHKELNHNRSIEFKEAFLIGISADDNSLLLEGDKVYEVSCQSYEIIKQWEHVYLFFYENIVA